MRKAAVSSPIIDSDGDRIPDSDDTISELWLLPSGVSTALIQTVPGQRLVLGETVFADARYRALLLPGDLDTLRGDDAMSLKETSGIGYLYPAGLFDLEIHSIASDGVAHLVIPVDGGIPDGAHVRRRDTATGQWQDVELTESDRVLSFGNSTEACPEPLHSRYVPGLTNGAHCLQLTIADGGINDADGSINGVVSLAVGIAVESLALPTIAAQNTPRNAGGHITERGEQVVLAFSLNSDHVDAELDEITLQASGVLDVATDIQQVALYVDINGNGIAEATERLATSHYEANNALLSFTLGTPHELLVGSNAFLVTYQF